MIVKSRKAVRLVNMLLFSKNVCIDSTNTIVMLTNNAKFNSLLSVSQ